MSKIEIDSSVFCDVGGAASCPSRLTHRSSLSLLRLCQLVSPALPVGAYHFSQGLEFAVCSDRVRDASSATEWIGGLAESAIGQLDLPVLFRLYDAWSDNDPIDARRWSQYLIASRETMELRAEERHMGKALAKVLIELELATAREWIASDDTCFASMFALAACTWHIERIACGQAYLWMWCENQVLAALKLLPIGQSAGQRILNRLLQRIPGIVEQARAVADSDIGIAAVAHGMVCAWHETQYSRLFRS